MSAAAASPEAVSMAGIPFPVASRPQARLSDDQTVSIISSGASFRPIQLPATGFVRRLSLFFTFTGTAASGFALAAGDAPWNLISSITLTDATGQPVMAPISGYNLYLVNKYLSLGNEALNNSPSLFSCPQFGPEYAFSQTGGTSATATFRLDIDFEQDSVTGYGCIPNLDSNASLQLKVDAAVHTVAFSGGVTVSAANLRMRVEQHYWAPVSPMLGGSPVQTEPVGFGDYVETRYETATVSASAENTYQVVNRGGLIKGIVFVSRAAGVRTAITAGSSFGLVLDNNPIFEGITIESWMDLVRKTYGYMGADLTTSYAPLTAGVLPGTDRGVIPVPFFALSGSRASWLATKVGSLLQAKLTPGAGATTLEAIVQIAQVKDGASFYRGQVI